MQIYRLSAHIRCEVLVLASAVLTLALTVPYALQMWNAPLNTYAVDKHGKVVDENKSSRRNLIAMYGLPPLFTIVLTVVNICMTLVWGRIFVPYTIGMTATMAMGWFVTAIFWAHCAIDDESQSWEDICYQTKLLGSGGDRWQGVSCSLGIFGLVAAIITLITYLPYLITALRSRKMQRRSSIDFEYGMSKESVVGISRW